MHPLQQEIHNRFTQLVQKELANAHCYSMADQTETGYVIVMTYSGCHYILARATPTEMITRFIKRCPTNDRHNHETVVAVNTIPYETPNAIQISAMDAAAYLHSGIIPDRTAMNHCFPEGLEPLYEYCKNRNISLTLPPTLNGVTRVVNGFVEDEVESILYLYRMRESDSWPKAS